MLLLCMLYCLCSEVGGLYYYSSCLGDKTCGDLMLRLVDIKTVFSWFEVNLIILKSLFNCPDDDVSKTYKLLEDLSIKYLSYDYSEIL